VRAPIVSRVPISVARHNFVNILKTGKVVMLKWYAYNATEKEVDDSERSAAMVEAVLGGIFCRDSDDAC
jgi:hypothetical protein